MWLEESSRTRISSPISHSHRPSSPSCLSFGFGFHVHHNNLSHDLSLSFSLRALKFKLQIRVHRTFLSLDIDPRDSNSTSASTLVCRRRREGIVVINSGRRTRGCVDYRRILQLLFNYRQSIIKLPSLSLSTFTSDFNVNIQCWAIDDQAAIAIRNSY